MAVSFQVSKTVSGLNKDNFNDQNTVRRKHRCIWHLGLNAVPSPTLPLTANYTRWTTCLKAAIYDNKFFGFYVDFHFAKKSKSDNIAVEKLLDLLEKQLHETNLENTFLPITVQH